MKVMDVFQASKHKNKNISVLVMTNNEVFAGGAIRNPIKNVSEFHGAMKNVLSLAQIFGVMPVYGIRDPSIDKLEFKWMSLKTVHSLIAIFLMTIFLILGLVKYVNDGMYFNDLVFAIYCIAQIWGYILFTQLARKWLHLNKKWLSIEKSMARYSYQPNDNRRFKITTIVIMTLALVEHLFHIVRNIHLSQSCPTANTDPLKAYFGICCSHLFSVTSYAFWKGFLVEIPMEMATFQWNFIDLFIILCSAAMAERFKQINTQIYVTQLQNYQFWKKTREDYNRLWNLCKTLDNAINNMVTVSFASNLFFICWQMFNFFKPKTDVFHLLYFMFSFGFLLGRTGAVSMYCCWINDESKDSLTTLFNIPQAQYCLEADRLINQICISPAALTGSNFFSVTRGLCLQVASAIITFEIIMVQMGPSFLKTDNVKPLPCIP